MEKLAQFELFFSIFLIILNTFIFHKRGEIDQNVSADITALIIF